MIMLSIRFFTDIQTDTLRFLVAPQSRIGDMSNYGFEL